ncbi:MAG: ABC transporter permease [Rhodospirillaceae bacterium]|jgi:peptide/nickel transport system permease protein|nr:ABC transporter permease [Rhodospirillaceae bacterium]MBT5667656.1 ABC transporter permease [Rhodospirillaceae bacterium]
MSTTELNSVDDPEALFQRKPLLIRVASLARRQPLGVAGALLVLTIVSLAVFADQIAPHDSELIDFNAMLTPPDDVYWLGTDQFGRDLWTRLMYGARTALFIGFIGAFVGATTGLVLGVASAYFGGNFDLIMQRIIDVFMAFPLIIMALALVAVFGNELQFVILAITLPFIPDCARIVRSNALQIREIPYVDAARALGFGHTRIILRHMLPNVMAPYLIVLTSNIGQAILLEASLSYLGLGVQEPTPSWGLMLQGGAEEYAESAPWVAVFPGLAIAVSVFGFNLFGDALRDVLDPRLRTR